MYLTENPPHSASVFEDHQACSCSSVIFSNKCNLCAVAVFLLVMYFCEPEGNKLGAPEWNLNHFLTLLALDVLLYYTLRSTYYIPEWYLCNNLRHAFNMNLLLNDDITNFKIYTYISSGKLCSSGEMCASGEMSFTNMQTRPAGILIWKPNKQKNGLMHNLI